MKKNLINIGLYVMAVCLLVINPGLVHAQTFNTETVNPIDESATSNQSSGIMSGIDDVGNVVINSNLEIEQYKDPANAATNVVSTDVTIEGLFEKILTKFKELLSNGQLLMMYICIGGFMVSALLAGFGALGHRGAMPSIIAAIAFAVAFTCIKYGPTIVDAISKWITG